jgi:Fis family transcriptional regulator
MNLERTTVSALGKHFKVIKQHNDEPLSDCVLSALDSYFAHLNGHSINKLHQMVIEEVERPLFQSTMTHAGGNQSKAAALLGISRSTLRKKLAYYGID